jgi:hypothetical protein
MRGAQERDSWTTRKITGDEGHHQVQRRRERFRRQRQRVEHLQRDAR